VLTHTDEHVTYQKYLAKVSKHTRIARKFVNIAMVTSRVPRNIRSLSSFLGCICYEAYRENERITIFKTTTEVASLAKISSVFFDVRYYESSQCTLVKHTVEFTKTLAHIVRFVCSPLQLCHHFLKWRPLLCCYHS